MPAPGSSTFGPYEIIGPLGAGGMGEVYRARDPRLQRNVALKILRASNGDDPLRQIRLLHEARAASALNHPNILVVYDVGAEHDVPYIVSELIEGASLRDLLSRGPLPVKELLDLAVQIADGLAAAHGAGLVHRDLKPENVMVTPDRRVKILDFGVAKMMSPAIVSAEIAETVAQQAETASGLIQGTVPYMSPEQARGGSVDFRSDQFSFGLLLYEMATGTRAFSRDTPVQTLTAIIEDEPRSLGDANPKTPIFLRWIVDHCLAKDPTQRYAATADLARDLRTLRDRLKETNTTSGTTERVRARSRRWPLLAAAIGGAAAMVVLGATLFRPAPLTIPRFTPLASDSGYQGMPSLSPDGKTVAYVADVDGVRQVFTRSLISSQRAQITHAKFDCANPFWAADGGRLYYVSAAKEGLGIYSVSAAGGSPALEELNADGGALSPDGRTLAFFRPDERGTNLQLWLSSPAGAEAKRYAHTPFGELTFSDAFMRFTPDGSRLAVWVRTWPMGLKSPSLWIIPLRAGTPYLAAGTPQDLSTNLPPRFDWLKDNRHIIAALERNNVQGLHLWLLDTETGESTPLTSGAGAEDTPSVSHDGRRIAYASQDINFDLIEVPIDGSPARDLLATSRSELEPGWSPTGEEFTFVTNRTGRDEIWLRSRDGSWERPLVTGDSFTDHSTLTFRLPVFSPDGQKIAFERVDTNGATIWIATRAGGSPVQVTRGATGTALSTYSPTWSPDGEWIAFANADLGQWSLEKVRAGVVTPPTMLHDITGDSHPQWSPDNRWIACSTRQGMSLVAPDGTSSKVLDEEAWIVYGWSKDGSTLYGVKQSDDERQLVLVSVAVASGRERVLNAKLAPLPAVNTPVKGFSRMSDRSFATSLVHIRSDLWTIDDFLPQPGLFDRLWPGKWY